MTCADFDGVIFHLWSPVEDKSTLNLSVQASAFATISKYGLQARLQQIYGPHLVATPENGFNVTLTVNTGSLPANSGAFNHTPSHTLQISIQRPSMLVIQFHCPRSHATNPY
jgi:actin related protein 2/3 complex subunit 2